MLGMPGQGSSTSRYLEVERKFDVDTSAVPPSFAGLAAVTRVEKLSAQSLDAVYFDTPAHDLASEKITLRRRTGGSDPGWHLNVSAGPDARTEVRAPLDAGDPDTVPGDLRDVVLAIVRDRPLAPVAQISTTRGIQLLHGTDGAVLAEFCDDNVTASAIGTNDATEQRWREWELELRNTPNAELLDRLSSRLLTTGAAPAGHGSKLARVLDTTPPTPDDVRAPGDPVHRAVAEQVDELLVADRAVRADADDAVHQMRVTTRKIRSLLQVSADTFGLSNDAWILDELRWLAGMLGVARDAEVLAQRYRQALDRLPPELVRGRVAERLVDGAARRYREGWRQSLIAMRSKRYFRLLDTLDALVAAPWVSGGATTPAAIGAAYRRVHKAAKAAARAAGDSGRDEALHRIRKGAKRLRYTAASTTDAPKVAARAKAIQTLLGDHQDSVVSRAHLLQQADAAHAAGEDTFSYGLLYQQEDDLARGCRSQLDRALGKLAKAVRKLR
jgi:CHAD domain-containing protein